MVAPETSRRDTGDVARLVQYLPSMHEAWFLPQQLIELDVVMTNIWEAEAQRTERLSHLYLHKWLETR